MKIRQSFVANSSSSSFIIQRKCLSDHQIQLIRDHFKLVEEDYDVWNIELTDHEIILSTMMDNFDMKKYLIKIVGVKSKNIKWSDY